MLLERLPLQPSTLKTLPRPTCTWVPTLGLLMYQHSQPLFKETDAQDVLAYRDAVELQHSSFADMNGIHNVS